MKNAEIYSTTSSDLAAYLMLQGLEYIGCTMHHDSIKQKPVALIKFKDPTGVGRDLERNFMLSLERRYREFHKYVLREVHKEINNYVRDVKQESEE